VIGRCTDHERPRPAAKASDALLPALDLIACEPNDRILGCDILGLEAEPGASERPFFDLSLDCREGALL